MEENQEYRSESPEPEKVSSLLSNREKLTVLVGWILSFAVGLFSAFIMAEAISADKGSVFLITWMLGNAIVGFMVLAYVDKYSTSKATKLRGFLLGFLGWFSFMMLLPDL